MQLHDMLSVTVQSLCLLAQGTNAHVILEAAGFAEAVAAVPATSTWTARRTWVVPPLHPLLGAASHADAAVYITISNNVRAQSTLRGLLVNGVATLAPSVILEAFAACLNCMADARVGTHWVLTNVDHALLVGDWTVRLFSPVATGIH